MCGIFGSIDTAGGVVPEDVMQQMAAALKHRGPDETGIEAIAGRRGQMRGFLGHTRLAVIDLTSGGRQPIWNEDRSVAVIFNGEIYNFRELRSELERHGHRFRSASDTEVLVHGYEEFGDDLPSRLNGMFAFAVWDQRHDRVVMARDAVGKKPLFYAWDGRSLTFASETKALRHCAWIDAGVRWEVLPSFLTLGYVPWPATFHRGISQVPPGSIVALERAKLLPPASYWKPSFASGPPTEWEDAVASTREVVSDAVHRRLFSDVPLGVLLSGGLDSSLIVALMAERTGSVRTFSVGFAEERSFDERKHARVVAERFGTQHTEVVVDAAPAEVLESVIWHLDQPLADSSAVPTFLIAREARKHVTVVLTGDGGDEVFGGYERFSAALLSARLSPALHRTIHKVATLLPKSNAYHGLQRRLTRFAATEGANAAERYVRWMSMLDTPEALALVDASHAREGSVSLTAALAETAQSMPLLHKLLYLNLRTYLHDDLLVKTDRMTMAHSLEARSPFLDRELIEHVSALPPTMKATIRSRKRLLKAVAAPVLPDSIINRRKHGFGVPLARWLRGDLLMPFRDLVLQPDGRVAEVLDVRRLERLLNRHVERKVDAASVLWGVLVLEIWLRSLDRATASRST